MKTCKIFHGLSTRDKRLGYIVLAGVILAYAGFFYGLATFARWAFGG